MRLSLSRSIVIVVSILTIFIGLPYLAQAAPPLQGPDPTPPRPPTDQNYPPLPDDIMPSITTPDQDQRQINGADYKVIPILFVPQNLTPNPFALNYIDNRMQGVQRWYGEQLRDHTFTLEPARLVTGSYSLSHYYDICYPPNSGCNPHWGYQLWDRIFDDLHNNLGYGWQSNRVLGVFFQHEGVGGTALGGGQKFLVVINPSDVFEDCREPGCAARVNEGGVAHELGHAFGLGHTYDDPEGSPSKSVMNYGFYRFPLTTFVNTSTNQEREHLYLSPFINTTLSLQDGGFEECLIYWTVARGNPTCTTSQHRSGLLGLQLPNDGERYRIYQTVTASAGESYDFSAWLKIANSSGNFNLQVELQALSTSGDVLETFNVADYTATTAGWERIAQSVTMPTGTNRVRIIIKSPTLRATAYLDDVAFYPSQTTPPTSLPMFYNNRDAVPTRKPLLKWADNTLATLFRVQVAETSSFSSPLIDTTVTSPFYQITSNLSYNTYYFWRVKAMNGAGESEWSEPWSFIPRRDDDYYNDEFETGTLDSAWSWVREDSSHWYFGGPRNRRGYGYMGIATQPGAIYSSYNNAKNLLLREPPLGDFEVSATYDFWEGVSTEYQQGGLLIYQDDENYIKLVRVYSGGHKLELQAEVNGTIVVSTAIPIEGSVPIKLTRIGNTYTGYYSPDGFNWRSIGSEITVNWSTPKMGLGAWSLYDVKQVTAYFDWFRVTTPLSAPPTAPTLVSTTAISETQVTVTWQDNSSDESEFYIEHSLDGATDWTETAIVGADVTKYQHMALSCSTAYFYRVRAHRTSDKQFSEYSNILSATTFACAPSILQAVAVSPTQIDLIWQDNSSDESEFCIERSPDGTTNWVQIAIVSPDVTSYPNIALNEDTTYFYRVRAHRLSDDTYSSYSNIASDTTDTAEQAPEYPVYLPITLK